MKFQFHCVKGEYMKEPGMYRLDEIKYNIDAVIQRKMFDSDKEDWKIILDIQRKLYEEFGIED